MRIRLLTKLRKRINPTVSIVTNNGVTFHWQFSLGGRVTPGASSPKVLSRISWLLNKMFYDTVCLKDPHGQLIRSFRMRRRWRSWRHEFDIIVTWLTSTRRRHFPVGFLLDTNILNRLVSEKSIITVADTQTHKQTRRLTIEGSPKARSARANRLVYNLAEWWLMWHCCQLVPARWQPDSNTSLRRRLGLAWFAGSYATSYWQSQQHHHKG